MDIENNILIRLDETDLSSDGLLIIPLVNGASDRARMTINQMAQDGLLKTIVTDGQTFTTEPKKWGLVYFVYKTELIGALLT